MAYNCIIVETRGKVGLIRLNRPKQLNALNDELMSELGDALAAFETDEKIGAIVITGSEKAFAAGADVAEMKDNSFADAYNSNFVTRNWDSISGCRKPVIAAVAGHALGGGCEIALACDFIIAADNAVFGQPEVKLAFIPGAGGTQRLPRLIGKARAMEMCLTGRTISAAEADRIGLVCRVVPVAELVEQADGAHEDPRRHAGEDRVREGGDSEAGRPLRLRGAARHGRLPRDRGKGASRRRPSRPPWGGVPLS